MRSIEEIEKDLGVAMRKRLRNKGPALGVLLRENCEGMKPPSSFREAYEMVKLSLRLRCVREKGLNAGVLVKSPEGETNVVKSVDNHGWVHFEKQRGAFNPHALTVASE